MESCPGSSVPKQARKKTDKAGAGQFAPEASADEGQETALDGSAAWEGPNRKMRFCMYHLQGVCVYSADRCAFAHSTQEIREAKYGRSLPGKGAGEAGNMGETRAKTLKPGFIPFDGEGASTSSTQASTFADDILYAPSCPSVPVDETLYLSPPSSQVHTSSDIYHNGLSTTPTFHSSTSASGQSAFRDAIPQSRFPETSMGMRSSCPPLIASNASFARPDATWAAQEEPPSRTKPKSKKSEPMHLKPMYVNVSSVHPQQPYAEEQYQLPTLSQMGQSAGSTSGQLSFGTSARKSLLEQLTSLAERASGPYPQSSHVDQLMSQCPLSSHADQSMVQCPLSKRVDHVMSQCPVCSHVDKVMSAVDVLRSELSLLRNHLHSLDPTCGEI